MKIPTTPADMVLAAGLFGNLQTDTPAVFDQLPFTFRIDGEQLHGIPSSFRRDRKREIEDANLVRTVFRGTSTDGAIEIRVTRWEYRDAPVVEWLAEVENRGTADTPVFSDLVLGGEIEGGFRAFVHGNGDTCDSDGYDWTRDTLESGPVTITPIDGTSCRGAFPYMKLVFDGFVVRAAVGWPHMWQATVTRHTGGVKFEAGQRRCHMRLYPGETIRTPKLTLMISEGDEDRSRNLWRRWYFTHVLPRENGHPIPPILCLHYWSCEGKPEHTAATEENQIRALREYVRRGLTPDLWWIDAGWYKCDYNWPHTGTWKPDPDRFPNGLGPIGRACDEVGARFMLWFEPERVRPGTELDTEHPEWLLRNGSENALLNLADPAACDWLIERVDSLIKESHIRIYRQDFNFDPKPYWEAAETVDRIGAIENLHAQGYLRFWDTLLTRNPGLWIDSCASGGRRNDLETMRRAVPLHYTDVGYGDHPVKQKQYRQMLEWIPYFRSHNASWDREYVENVLGQEWVDNDEFSFETAIAPAVTYMTWWDAPEEQYERTRRAVKVWRRAAAIMLEGDYWPLTECRKSAGDWYAVRFENDQGEGFVQFLRNREAEDESLTVPFPVEEGKRVRFEHENGETFEKSAEELNQNGLTRSLPKRAGEVIFYKTTFFMG